MNAPFPEWIDLGERVTMQKIKNLLLRILPGYGWRCLLTLMALQLLVFDGTRIPLRFMERVDLSTPLDLLIPFRPEWIVIYVLSFLSWGVTFLILFRQEKEQVYRNSAAYFLTLLLTGAMFLLLPGTLVRPQVVGDDVFSRLTRLVYAADPPDNLCPSLHVICSYYCWRGLFGAKAPKWYKGFNFVFLLLVCCSILFVKQHVITDIPVAILISEGTLQLCRQMPTSWLSKLPGYAKMEEKNGRNHS